MEIKTTKTNSSGLTGNMLKTIAVISMLIDHVAASFIDPAIYSDTAATYSSLTPPSALEILSTAMHLIGRLAFPILLFLLIEGFYHTKSIKKYILRMGIFAVISEIPFDLCIYGEVFARGGIFPFSYLNNVFFTLTLALIAIWIIDSLFKSNLAPTLRYIITAVSVILISLVTLLIGSDYEVIGIVSACVMYLIRRNQSPSYEFDKKSNIKAYAIGTAILCIFSIDEAFAFLAIPLISRYNGQRGKYSCALKYAFYLFYPLHLILLYVIRLICIK